MRDPIFYPCQPPPPPQTKVPEGWHGWGICFSVVIEEIAAALSRSGRSAFPAERIATECRNYGGYVGRRSLIATDELPEGGEDGFRLFWRESTTQWIDVVRMRDGSILVVSSLADWDGIMRFAERIQNPSECLAKQIDLGIEYLLMN